MFCGHSAIKTKPFPLGVFLGCFWGTRKASSRGKLLPAVRAGAGDSGGCRGGGAAVGAPLEADKV